MGGCRCAACVSRMLRKRNVFLTPNISEDGEEKTESPSVTKFSSPEEKIALFRSLFRGRDDVYPQRFESRKSGKNGYVPACGNEWIRGLCDKRKVKCVECPNRQFLPVTTEVIRWHLSGADDGAELYA